MPTMIESEERIGSVDNFEYLFKEMISLFDETNELSPSTYSQLVSDAFNKIETEAENFQLKASCDEEKLPKAQTILFLKQRKIEMALPVVLLTCLLVGLPVFYTSSEEIVTSILSNPYVQIIVPKEYSYQVGVFFMNLHNSLARIVRFYASHVGSQHILGWFGIGQNPASICMVSNPMYQRDTPQPCSLCDGKEEVVYHKSSEGEEDVEDFENTVTNGNIHIFEQAGLATSLHILQQHVSQNQHNMDLKRHTFESNINYIKSVRDLGLKQIISHLLYDMPADGHVVWSTGHYIMSMVMKRVFPRPPVVPAYIPLSLNKAIMLDGPESPEYKMPVSNDERDMTTLYIQGFGSRVIRLVPGADCVVKYSTHTVITRSGDVLIYDALIWTAYSLPTETHRSFAYVTHLLFEVEES